MSKTDSGPSVPELGSNGGLRDAIPAWAGRFRKATHGNGLRAQLLRGGAGSLVVKAAHAVIAFALAVVLARLLGPEGYGVYAFALAVLMLAAIPAQVGIPQLIVRETAKAHAKEDWGLMRGLWRWGNLAVFAFSVIGVLLVSSVLIVIVVTEGARAATVAVGVALIPLVALANVRAACLRGLRLVVWGQLPESIFRPVLLMILVGVAVGILSTDFAQTPKGVMALHVVAASIAFVLGAAMLWMARPVGVKSRPFPRYESANWQRAVLPLAMITGLQLINSQADLIMLGIFRADDEVGIYRAAVQVALLVIFGLQAMNQVLQPYFARLYAQGDMPKLQRIVTASARAILLLALPPVGIFMLFGPELLGWVFGDAFRAGGLALAILAAGQLVNAGMGSVGMLLNMTGHERDTMRGIAVAAVSNLILNLILIPSFGMTGAASASAATFVMWNFLLRYFVRKRLGIETLAWNFANGPK